MSGADFAARAIALDGLARLGSSDAANGAMLVGYRGTAAQAVGRKIAEKLDDAVSVRDFGAVGDGVTDDTAAIRRAIRALKSRSSLFAGYRLGTGRLFFPEGVYRLTESGVLSDLAAVGRSSIVLKGAGWRNTILWLDPAGLSEDAFFYDNGATRCQWGMVCEDICFAGGTTWMEADPLTDIGNGYANVSAFSKGFKLTGPGWESGFVFNRCQFRFLAEVFHCAGGNNVDTHRFIACEVSKCINVTYINNPQSFSVNWIGCYLTEIFGNTLRYGPNATGGGNFAMIGGAVIAQSFTGQSTSGMSYVAHVVDGGPTLANAPITFSDVRFELRGNWHGMTNVSFANAIVTFRDCSFHNTGTNDKNAVTVSGYCTVKFDGGAITNGSGGGRFKFVIGSATDGRRGKNAHLLFTGGCVVPSTMTSTGAPDVLWAGTGGRLTIDETCAPDSQLDPTADPRVVSYACDIWGPASISGGGLAASTRNRTRKRFSVNPFYTDVQLTGAAGLAGTAIAIPPYSRIVEIWVKIEPGQGNGNTIRCLIGSDDKSVVYAQTELGPQNAGQFAIARDLYIPVEADGNKRRVRFWFDNGAGGNSGASSSARVDGGVVYE